MKENKLTGRDIIKQSHELNKAHYKLGALSMDIIYAMISELKKEDKDFKLYEISLSILEKKLGKRVDSKYLDLAVKDVMSNPIRQGKANGGFKYISWVSVFEYNGVDKVISFRFDNSLKPFLLELKDHFVLSQLREISSLQSEYAKRIYNLLKQWTKLGTFKINVESLQELLQVPKSLKTYSNFKLKVLGLSIPQINKNTSLNITYKEIKTGRKITSLVFSVREERKAVSSNGSKVGISAIEDWLIEEDIIDIEVG